MDGERDVLNSDAGILRREATVGATLNSPGDHPHEVPK